MEKIINYTKKCSIKNFLINIIVLFVILFLVCACSNSNSKSVPSSWNKIETKYSKDDLELYTPDILNVITTPGYIPYEYFDNDRLVGIDIDLTNMIADSLDLKCRITPLDYNSAIKGLKTNNSNDIYVGTSVKSIALEDYVDFSIPYHSEPMKMHIVAKKDSNIDESNLDSGINNQSITVFSQKNSGFWWNFINWYPNAKFSLEDSNKLNLNKFLESNSSIFLFDDNMYNKYKDSIKLVKTIDFQEEYVVYVKKNKTKLLECINEVLEKRKADSSIDNIIEKYSGIESNYEELYK